MSDYTEVDGVDYSPEAIEEVRKTLGEHRAQSMKVWPDGIAYSVLMSHVIALLHKLQWYEEKARANPPAPTKRASPPRPNTPHQTSTGSTLPPLPPVGNG